MKKIIQFILIALFIIPVAAQIDRSQQPASGPAPKINLDDPKIFTLNNGLTVLVVENHKLPRVNAYLNFDNPPKYWGAKSAASDLMGGMLGEGTTNMDKDAFNQRVDFLGASLNFSSSGASMNALSRYYKEVLGMMADAIKNPLFEEDEFEKEKQNLIDGLKADEKSVSSAASRVRRILTYGKNHAYADFTTIDEAEKVQLQDVKSYFKDQFVPKNAYLVVAGDVEFNDVKSEIENLFGDWKKAEPITQKMEMPTAPTKTAITLVDMPNAVQSEIALAYPIQRKMNDKDFFAALLASHIYGGSFNSRLNMNLREEHGYTYGARGGLNSDKFVARFYSSAAVRNEVTDSAVAEALKEFKGMFSNPVTEEELANAKAKYTGDFIRDLEDSRNQAFNAIRILTNDLPKDFYRNYLKNLNAVTKEEVMAAVNKYFKPDNAHILVTGKASEVYEPLKRLGYEISFMDQYGNPAEAPSGPKDAGSITATQVIDKYLAFSGGREKLNSLKTLKTVYDATSPQIPMPGIVYTEAFMMPYSYKRSMELPGMGPVFKQVYNGEAGYTEAMNAPRTDMTEEEVMENKKNPVFPELDFSADEISLEGIVQEDGKEVYQINVAKKEGKETRYYSVESGALVKIVNQTKNEDTGAMATSTITLGEHMEQDGIQIPKSLSINQNGQFEMNCSLKEAMVNTGVEDSDFE